jgi:diguanylate cyclase (GGDEF)-like protein
MLDDKVHDEPGRLAALHRYCVLDTAPERAFDKITSLVRTVLNVPICVVSLVDEDRQWFKSAQGLDATQTPRNVSFCTHTIMTREPMAVPDATRDPRFADNPLVTGEPRIVSYLGVPLRTPDGYNVGSLCAIDTKARDHSPADLELLSNFAALVVDELELRTIAQKDFLTGTMTRRTFVEAAEAEIERFRRYRRDASLVTFDIDHFKQINDTLGHPAGDVVLKTVARTCAGGLRPNDFMGRLGGEEFGILLPEASADEAVACAERMRRAIELTHFDIGTRLRVTASFGIAPLTGDVEGLDGWLAQADGAMYRAKRTGRNRCVIAEGLLDQVA